MPGANFAAGAAPPVSARRAAIVTEIEKWIRDPTRLCAACSQAEAARSLEARSSAGPRQCDARDPRAVHEGGRRGLSGRCGTRLMRSRMTRSPPPHSAIDTRPLAATLCPRRIVVHRRRRKRRSGNRPLVPGDQGRLEIAGPSGTFVLKCRADVSMRCTPAARRSSTTRRDNHHRSAVGHVRRNCARRRRLESGGFPISSARRGTARLYPLCSGAVRATGMS